ncbi:MAG: hypothetical protein R3D55_10035 [Chloroflexota bacterium]
MACSCWQTGRTWLTTALGALKARKSSAPAWQQLERWRRIFGTGQALLDAPTVTENFAKLLRRSWCLLEHLERQDRWSPVLDAPLPIMTSTNLRDSERVDFPEDRLVYLNGWHCLGELQHTLSSLRGGGKDAGAIVRRWTGLVTAASGELRGG